jgi:hypothetical protein
MIGLAFALSACASPSADGTQQMANGGAVVCKREKVMGSHRSTRICRTRAQIEAEQAASEKTMETLRRVSNTGSGGENPAP